MTATVRHLSTSRVAPAGSGPARAWLARRQAWERRLAELEGHPAPKNRHLVARGLKRTA